MLTKDVQGTTLTPAMVLANPDVQNGMLAAWNETQKHHVEFGGWIYYKHADQSYRTTQKKGEAMGVILTPALLYKKGTEGYEIVADWHCHPGHDVAASRPSKQDIQNAKAKKYFMFVVTPKREPKNGWPAELLKEIAVVDDSAADRRIWNII